MQKYIQGELVYIAKPSNKRASWGEVSGKGKLLAGRNAEIYRLYSSGWSACESGA